MDESHRCIVSMKLDAISLPPVQDILILGRDTPYGPEGIHRSFNLLAPDDFEVVELQDKPVQAILINRKLLRRMSKEEIIDLLRQKAFPFLSSDEIVKVEFKVAIAFDSIELSPIPPAPSAPPGGPDSSPCTFPTIPSP